MISESPYLNLEEVAEKLRGPAKGTNLQLIYAFNGVGKTRLSSAFSLSIPESDRNIEDFYADTIYYNTFIEEMFQWDLGELVLKIKDNKLTNLVKWAFRDEGIEYKLDKHINAVGDKKLQFKLGENYDEVVFSKNNARIKPSNGEETFFLWSLFYLVVAEVIARKDEDETALLPALKYVFIDDPVSSLDDNYILQVVRDIDDLIKKSNGSEKLQINFVVTTHSPAFYNLMWNGIAKNSRKYLLKKHSEDEYSLVDSKDSPVAYHLELLKEIKSAIAEDRVKKYHFNFFRNVLEKTATFLGQSNWKELSVLKKYDEQGGFYRLLINYSSHSSTSNDEISLVPEEKKNALKRILERFIEEYGFSLN